MSIGAVRRITYPRETGEDYQDLLPTFPSQLDYLSEALDAYDQVDFSDAVSLVR